RMTVKGEAKREWGMGSGEWGWESNIPSPIPHSPFPTRRSLFALLAIFVFFASRSLSYAQPAKDQNQEVGSVIEKNNVAVYVAFTLLVECCLPNGTRLTSGFRAASDQLAVIRHYAQVEGISVPANMRVEKPETWRPVLAELRKRNYVIADPDKTPHSS